MKSLITFIITLNLIVTINAQNEQDQDKYKVYETIRMVDKWYKEGYVHYWNVREKWYLNGENSEDLTKKYTPKNYSQYASERILAMDSLGILTDDYNNILKERLNRSGNFNETMILTNHKYGDMVNSFLVERNFMDYLAVMWKEGPPFAEFNSELTDSAYIEWHLDRITIFENDKAEYKVLYTELGDVQDIYGDYEMFKIIVIKEKGAWKIDNMRIEFKSKEETIDFYNRNLELRGYFD